MGSKQRRRNSHPDNNQPTNLERRGPTHYRADVHNNRWHNRGHRSRTPSHPDGKTKTQPSSNQQSAKYTIISLRQRPSKPAGRRPCQRINQNGHVSLEQTVSASADCPVQNSSRSYSPSRPPGEHQSSSSDPSLSSAAQAPDYVSQ